MRASLENIEVGPNAESNSLVAQRGVVFFRAQDGLTNELQKKLILRLGELTGRPKTSTLHIHPLLNTHPGLGGDDPEISSISSKQFSSYRSTADTSAKPVNSEHINLKNQNNASWHSDISFEPIPSDFTSLRLIELPETGGGQFSVSIDFTLVDPTPRLQTLTRVYA